MISRSLFSLFLLTLLFTACSKSPSPVGSREFIIQDVHDVDMTDPYNYWLTVHTTILSGEQEAFDLSVIGLPKGITATVEPSGGTMAEIYTTVSFFQTGNAQSGIYPIQLLGTTPYFSKAYKMVLTVPQFNGWVADDTAYRKDNLQRENVFGNGVLSVQDQRRKTLTFSKAGDWPTANGTYTYPVGDSYLFPGHVEINLSGYTGYGFINTNPGTTTLTYVMSGGKATITLPPTAMEENGRSIILSASIRE